MESIENTIRYPSWLFQPDEFITRGGTADYMFFVSFEAENTPPYFDKNEWDELSTLDLRDEVDQYKFKFP